jgi:asparagine synthase (glutamine-hydrolysing)
MSAQAGIWNFDGRPVDRKLIEHLSESLSQQGPDGESRYVDGSVALLYRPFHTTAESRREKQPCISHRGFVLTWDGRLDNREALIAELRNDLDHCPTDLAIVAASFDRWKTDCFRRFVGDWAVSVWDPTEKTLHLAKDYAGIRQLYYYLNDTKAVWCTDLETLVLKTGVSFTLNEEYIAGYLVMNPGADLTPYKEIRAVPPGHFVTIPTTQARVCRYWSFVPRRRTRYKTDAEYEEHFLNVFREAVCRRMRSDCAILAELSGGLDSSAIVCMADDIMSKGKATTPRLDTVSAYDPHDVKADERPYFTKVEQKRGKIGFHLVLGTDTLSIGLEEFRALPGSLWNKSASSVSVTDVMQQQGNRVLLSGIGGDEFLGGVPDPRPQLADLIVQFHFTALARELMAWSLAKKQPWLHVLGRTLVWLSPPSLRAHLSEEAKIAPWIDRMFARRHGLAVLKLGPHQSFGFWLPTRRETAKTLASLTMQMARQLPSARQELRYPFLDQTLVEFLISIPENQLLRPGERRSLMRRALIGIVPPEILSRPTKGTSARSYMAALEARWADLQTVLVSPLSARLGYVNQKNFQGALDAARTGNAVQFVGLLHVLALELWLRDVIRRGLLSIPKAFGGLLDAEPLPLHCDTTMRAGS